MMGLQLIAQAAELSAGSRLATVRLTKPQYQFASNPARKLIWRGANTIGKSVGLAWHVVHALRGTHPYVQLPKPPVRLLVVSENYPQLKADATMRGLMEELTSTENRIAFARQAFNDAVLFYNNGRETFPRVLIANLFGFLPAEFFKIENEAEKAAPKVSF